MRTARIALVACAFLACWGAPASAQRRVIVLDAVCGCAYCVDRLPLEWMIAAADPCPGATLLRLCGGAASAECPSVEDALARLGDAGLDRCRPDAALLGPAATLYETSEVEDDLLSAERVYRVAARDPALRDIALYRAARAAYRRSRYPDSIRTLGELLSAGPSPPMAHAAIEIYVRALLYGDWNEDQIADADQGLGVARFEPPYLPDAPWAYDVALAALRAALEWDHRDAFTTALATLRRRWPARADGDRAELDALEADHLERNREMDELERHLHAAAERCRARHEPCDGPMLDRARDLVAGSLGACRAASDEAAAVTRCEVALDRARRLIAARADPEVERDITTASAWLEAMRARLRSPPRVRRRTPPPADPTFVVRRSPIPDSGPSGDLDAMRFQRGVDLDALRTCAPPGAAAIDVSLVIALDGSVRSATSSTPGAVASCVLSRLRATRIGGGPEGGEARVEGVVLFGPGASSAR